MKFIKLTVITKQYKQGEKKHILIVNVDNILSIEQGPKTSYLVMSNNSFYDIWESPEEILKLIKKSEDDESIDDSDCFDCPYVVKFGSKECKKYKCPDYYEKIKEIER